MRCVHAIGYALALMGIAIMTRADSASRAAARALYETAKQLMSKCNIALVGSGVAALVGGATLGMLASAPARGGRGAEIPTRETW